ncbi:MAG: tRNA uridine-5-carboxymethylaminomethyl(34) synthesis GTPase MnmE, partial [Deltaproteobacteria bacterium]|nr:tRNA uridine-5-carboxymethylaminomethyl(34) synthesis GTPase MnmE [Deltaproteobacteria bacterium]
KMSKNKTIAAIATPPGTGGVGVIRLSGEKSKEVLRSLWKSHGKSVDNFASHRLYLGNFVDPATGEVVDKGMAVWMQAPHSYTGEEVVELQLHGSPLILDQLLAICIRGGCQMAEPGEFTKRAYLNGKIDLSQAEAVADLIHASSEAGARQAKEHLAGRLSQKIREFQEELVRLRAFVEASIDFPEEDIELIQKEGILSRLTPIRLAIAELLATYKEGRIHREGLKTVLVGRPNAGKSSLLNSLLGIGRAIVHHQPGTTRDSIEESVSLNGHPFRLFDTAGLREGTEEVEAIGVAKTQELLQDAELVLWVVDGSSPLQKEDFDFLSTLDLSKTIICVNKVDLPLVWDPANLISATGDLVKISALVGEGVTTLKEKMVGWVKRLSARENTGLCVSRLRHKESLEKAEQSLQEAEQFLQTRGEVELLALHLKKAHEHLGEITGSNISEDLLDKIFREFCIGK